MKNFRVCACATLVSVLSGCSVFTEPGPERYSALLKVDATRSPVIAAPNATGSALFLRRRTLLDFIVDVSSLSSSATAAHIHGPAAPGAVAEILVEFRIAPATTGARLAGGVLSSSASPRIPFDSLLALMRTGNAYVDVHTELNPAGEIFGQIERGDLISPNRGEGPNPDR